MTQELLPWIEQTQVLFFHWFTIFLRIAAFMALFPGIGEQAVSTRVKVALAVAVSLAVAPVIPPVPKSSDLGALQPELFTEPLIGLLFGLGVRLFIIALQTAGTIAAQSTSLSQILGNASIEPIPAMAHILVISAICLAFVMDAHITAIELIVASYTIFPIGSIPLISDTTQWGISQVSHIFALSFTLAAPFVVFSLLYNLALGAISKAMPQLMVAFVGAPFITLGGLVLLLLSSPILLSVWYDAFNTFLTNPLSVPK